MSKTPPPPLSTEVTDARGLMTRQWVEFLRWLVGRATSAAAAGEAPNVTSATAEAFYADLDGNESATGEKYGLRGTITLPTAHTNYGHLRQIQVVAIPPDLVERVVAVLTAPWGVDVVDWVSWGVWDRPEPDVTFPKVEFRCLNGDSAVTVNPFTVANVLIAGQARTPAPPMGLADPATAAAATVRYGVFEEMDGARTLKVQVSGTVTPPADAKYLQSRITITAGGTTFDLGYTYGDHTFVGDWQEIPPGSYELRAYPVNRENAENPAPFVSPDPVVIDTMPLPPAITDPYFAVEDRLYTDTEGVSRHEFRITGGWTQDASDYQWYVWLQLRTLAGADPRPLVPVQQVSGDERTFVTGWLPVGATTTYQVEFVAVNRMETEAAPVVVGEFTIGPYGTPDAALFKAGTSLGDGEFNPVMRWDSSRQLMLIDWAVVLPTSLANWSGLAVWIKTASGHFSQATSVLDRSMFAEDAEGIRYIYDTIAIEPQHIPNPDEAWTFIAVSYTHAGEPKRDELGEVTGPIVVLQTLPKSDHVLDFSAVLVRQYTEAGNQVFGYSCSWTQPAIPRYRAIKIIERDFFGAGTSRPISGEILLGTTGFETALFPIPETSTPVRLVAQGIFGDGSEAPLDECPTIPLTVERIAGPVGREFAELVTGFNAVVATPAYATNGDGQKVLKINLSWSNPADVRFGGVYLFASWYDGVTYLISGLERGTSFAWETTHFPSSLQSATFYALSADTSNRRNTYAGGTTPSRTINIPAPTLGAAGTEYTSHVSSFSASVSYPANSDGTYQATITATFIPPSDSTWGGLELVTFDGAAYAPRVRVRTSPAVVTIPVPAAQQSWSVYGVSFDVNGRRNAIAAGTPRTDIIIGTSLGQLDFTKAKATTYDPDIFKIEAGLFKVWRMMGSLLVDGTVESKHLNATEVRVGGGGSKPGKLAVYNGAGQEIGFLGIDGSDSNWLKTQGIGGPNKSAPKFFADASGNVSLTDGKIQVTAAGYKVYIDPADAASPLRVFEAAVPTNEVRVRPNIVEVGDFGLSGLAPLAAMERSSSHASTYITAALQRSCRMKVDQSSDYVEMFCGVPDLARYFHIYVQRNTAVSEMRLSNMGVLVDGFATWTGTIDYAKPGGGSGQITVRRGWVTGVT